jgi:hypothetical protein
MCCPVCFQSGEAAGFDDLLGATPDGFLAVVVGFLRVERFPLIGAIPQ